MTVEETSGRVDERLYAEIAELLREATGEESDWAAAITPATRLEDDLRIESVEVTALAVLLRRRYGERVDLPAFLAELDIDQLIALTVGDLAAYIARGRGASEERASPAASANADARQT